MDRPVTSSAKIVIMEDHDQAYYAWKDRGVKGRTLVHVDAHIDFGWLPDTDMSDILNISDADEIERILAAGPLLNPFSRKIKRMMHIGNYICPAMREGIVDKFYWVVPDPTWWCVRGQRIIRNNLRQAMGAGRFSDGRLTIRDDRISCRVFGKEIVAMPLSRFPRIEEKALLDIDTDFMLTPLMWDDRNPRRTPWVFPEELLEKLHVEDMDVDMLTIAYSVNGGFTPIRHKYLGDELRARFEGPLDARLEEIADLRRAGTVEAYEEALRLGDEEASSYFNLAVLCMEQIRDVARAREYYRKAIEIDKSYAGAYNNCGILFLNKNRWRRAEDEFSGLLSLDEGNVHALNGLGYAALGRNRYDAAERFFQNALERDVNNRRALFGSAVTYFGLRRFEEAKKIFLEMSSTASPEPEVYWYLAKISAVKRELTEASDYYKKAVMAGGEGPAAHFEMCFTCMKMGLYRRALEEFGRFGSQLTKDIAAICSI